MIFCSLAEDAARAFALIPQFGAAAAVVDEPVADLGHADAGDLWENVISIRLGVFDDRAMLTLEKRCFCSSLGYGLAMF